MEQTFMTIHNLTPDANILFASESIFDILGYGPQEVLGRSSFDYFHPEEVPFARSVHSRGILLDKAAVLHYCRVLSRDGRWIGCECCFTIVHDVLVACTSIYRQGERSERRAIEAPQIRRLFSCSPRDPRYHMLEHLSPKFKMPSMEREPRAALILNRFTRTLTVMFATEAISSILGVSSDEVRHKSFYECIRETSLSDAFKCVESAKANDSIAYLRFWSRDPRRPEDFDDTEEDDETDDGSDRQNENNDAYEPMELNDDVGSQRRGSPSSRQRLLQSRRSSDSEGGGVRLNEDMDVDSLQRHSPPIKIEPDVDVQPRSGPGEASTGVFSSTNSGSATHASVWNSSASTSQTDNTSPISRNRTQRRHLVPSVELEAVVSCTSDGLVVILRRARPPLPGAHPPLVRSEFDNGLFAAPWGQQPIRPDHQYERQNNFQPRGPQQVPIQGDLKSTGGPPLDHLMTSIRDVAVFAWALVGINGNIASYGRGNPTGEAQPPDGLPIWDPTATSSSYLGPENQATRHWMNHQTQRGESSRCEAPPYAGSSRDVNTNYSGLMNDRNYSFGNESMWASPTQPGVLSSWREHPPIYNPAQGAIVYQNNHRQPQGSDEWSGSSNSGNHRLFSPRREPRHHRQGRH